MLQDACAVAIAKTKPASSRAKATTILLVRFASRGPPSAASAGKRHGGSLPEVPELWATLGYLGDRIEEVEKTMKLVVTSLVAGALMLVSTQVATPSPATAGLVVHATIWPNLDITFSPKTIKHGAVVIKVKNRTSQAHKFSINGVTSANISPHAVVAMKVTFKRRATYTATLADCGYPSDCVGGNPDTGPVGNAR